MTTTNVRSPIITNPDITFIETRIAAQRVAGWLPNGKVATSHYVGPNRALAALLLDAVSAEGTRSFVVPEYRTDKYTPGPQWIGFRLHVAGEGGDFTAALRDNFGALAFTPDRALDALDAIGALSVDDDYLEVAA